MNDTRSARWIKNNAPDELEKFPWRDAAVSFMRLAGNVGLLMSCAGAMIAGRHGNGDMLTGFGVWAIFNLYFLNSIREL